MYCIWGMGDKPVWTFRRRDFGTHSTLLEWKFFTDNKDWLTFLLFIISKNLWSFVYSFKNIFYLFINKFMHANNTSWSYVLLALFSSSLWHFQRVPFLTSSAYFSFFFLYLTPISYVCWNIISLAWTLAASNHRCSEFMRATAVSCSEDTILQHPSQALALIFC